MAPLDSAWLKLDRAKAHIDKLRVEVTVPENPHVYRIPVARQYEPDSSSILCRVGKMDHWPLIVGDAIHNLRSALDHAWWQCAIKHKGRELTECEAKRVFFPVRKPGNDWEPSTYVFWVGEEVEAVVHRYQPPKSREWGDFHPLGSIERLSNIDKHRTLPVLLRDVQRVAANNSSPDQYVDCFAAPRPGEAHDPDRPGRRYGPATDLVMPGIGGPNEGDEVMWQYVQVTGPNPHVKFEPDLTGQIALHGDWDLMDSLERMGATVADIIREIEPRL